MSENSGNDRYQVFARKDRPRTFQDILGQDHVVQTLKNAITNDRLAHAYLFVGPRGTGKTTTARILAKALNCTDGPKVDFDPDEGICLEIAEGNSLDVLEFDAASNTQVEKIRDLIIDTVKYRPTNGIYKLYIVDEVHMLSRNSFNALLKTLEEPPEHVIFAFATTDPEKVPATILSRCQRFDLRRIPVQIIADHLLHIAREEKITLNDAAAYAIARGADGGMRDAQSMLDQLVAFCGNTVDESNVLEIFGFNSAEAIAELAGTILQGNSATTLEKIHSQSEAGKDLGTLLADLITHFRHLLVTTVDPDSDSGDIPPELREILAQQRGQIATGRLLHLIDQLAETDARIKWAPNKKLHLEIGLIKAIQSLGETSLDDVISLISDAANAAPTTGSAAPATSPAVSARAQQPAAPGVPEKTPAPVKSTAPATPAAPVPTPEPAASPEPTVEAETPSPPPMPSGPLEGDALWETARQHLVAERPLIHAWLESARILQQNDRQCVIGLPVEQDFFRESLGRHKELIQKIISQLAGKPLEIRLELSDTLKAVESEPDPDPEPEAPQAEAAPQTVAATNPPPANSAPAGTGEPAAAVTEAEPEDDFHNDPLIQKALDEFQGTVLDES